MPNTNPIISEFLNTGKSITEILEKYYSKEQYLEVIFLKLTTSLKIKNFDNHLFEEIDQAIINGHPDSQVYFLFVTYAVSYALQINQIEKANVLCSIASSIPQNKNETFLYAYYLHIVARIKYNEGKCEECKKLIIEILPLLVENYPMTKLIRLNCMNMIGGIGQLVEMKNYYENIPIDIKKDNLAYLYIEAMLLNCMETGNCEMGFKLVDEFRNNYKGKMPYLSDGFKNLLKIVSGDFIESNYQEKAYKIYANVCNSLSMGKIEEANKYYNLLVNLNKEGYLWPNLSDAIPLHIELSSRNSGKARLLLLEFEQKGKWHYIDDLFFGRLQLLEKNIEGADKSFRRLIENIKKYEAMNRLVFELQFAREMKLTDILRLMNGWQNSAIQLDTNEEFKIAIKPKREYKGAQSLIGKSKIIQFIKNQVKKYASLKDIVLVTGETGTGKELVAKAIHEEGPHSKEPFLAINCGALTDTLLQSELFGYEAGAFTGAQKERKGIFESAGRGTVFLDEFGDISPKLQVSLLRVLESNEIRLLGGTVNRQIECKMVIATNVNLQHAVEEKKIREDLFFRLARFEIKLPTLRERKEDLPELIQYFLDRNNGPSDQKKFISNNLLDALSSYHWPGNIRELKNEIDRLYILNPDNDLLDVSHFDFNHLQGYSANEVKPQARDTNKEENSQDHGSKEDPHFRIIQSGFLMEKRHALLKELFKKYKKLTRKQVAEISKVGTNTATKDLQILCDDGFIVRRTPTKSTRTDYFEIIEVRQT